MSYGDPAPFRSHTVTPANFAATFVRVLLSCALGSAVTWLSWSTGHWFLASICLLLLIFPVGMALVMCLLVAQWTWRKMFKAR